MSPSLSAIILSRRMTCNDVSSSVKRAKMKRTRPGCFSVARFAKEYRLSLPFWILVAYMVNASHVSIKVVCIDTYNRHDHVIVINAWLDEVVGMSCFGMACLHLRHRNGMALKIQTHKTFLKSLRNTEIFAIGRAICRRTATKPSDWNNPETMPERPYGALKTVP